MSLRPEVTLDTEFNLRFQHTADDGALPVTSSKT